MIFLIEYNRAEGKVVNLRRFSDMERLVAENERLDIELRLNREMVNHEVVILEAESMEALLKTHRRYFQNLSEIADSFNLI